jgi:hypothetical protein
MSGVYEGGTEVGEYCTVVGDTLLGANGAYCIGGARYTLLGANGAYCIGGAECKIYSGAGGYGFW